MTRPSRACIDLHALRHNFTRVQQAAPRSRIMAIVKANAYGHGLLRVAQALSVADAFGVVTPEEGIALREAGVDRRIVLLEGLFCADDVALASGYHLDAVVHHATQLDILRDSAPVSPIDVWLKLDTGMNRLGFDPAEAAGIASALQAMPQVGALRYMTHFACADEPDNPFTEQQAGRFTQAIEGLQGERALANSAAVLAWPQMHADWVRPGIMLYGASPLQGQSADDCGLQPVMTLKTRLIAIRHCRRDDTVGYGATWRCPEDMRVGVAAIGYGDGYPRHAGSGTPVAVRGRRAPLIGRVSMDMLCVDLRARDEVAVGDEVVLWGEGLPVEEIAGHAGTLAYELLCGISKRVSLEYTG